MGLVSILRPVARGVGALSHRVDAHALRPQVQRGGATRNVQIDVGDLDAITPASYIEFGESVVHDLSYQHRLPHKRDFLLFPLYNRTHY